MCLAPRKQLFGWTLYIPRSLAAADSDDDEDSDQEYDSEEDDDLGPPVRKADLAREGRNSIDIWNLGWGLETSLGATSSLVMAQKS